ncbi:MAG TPA: acyl-CoA dehydrogenase family protein [Gammaproteobacteria bacterium]|nr:acyl-CoA dehydrogenase family protein [Gammaproteobacteria bacterium]
MEEFFQTAPELGNQYESDVLLRHWLARVLPADLLAQLEPGLRALGARAAGDMLVMAADAEANPPRHIPYDPWGRRIDVIETARGWRDLLDVAAEEGIVAAAYEREHGAHSRVHQFVRLYLYNPSSAIASCPLSMTDGAARVIELFGDEALQRDVLPHLISRDPAEFWTGGQWMTERRGGSDVRSSRTVARADDGGWRLFGTKWFTSATTGEIAMTLARIEEEGQADDDLSLFYLKLRDDAGRLNDIFVHRLKDKLGTRALPTAELTLQGTPAILVGERGRGVAQISTILNITRLYNAVAAVSYMRRGIALARDYAGKRRAFGKLLAEQPLHAETLADLEAEHAGAFYLAFEMARLLGRDECNEASDADKGLLRLMTPVVKLYTAKQAIGVASEVLECFGGQGYIEDTGLPTLLRNCQVLSIWEGTTNVLALDVLRALKRPELLKLLIDDTRRRISAAIAGSEELRGQIEAGIEAIASYGARMATTSAAEREAGARRFAYAIARTYGAALLADGAAHAEDEHATWLTEMLRRWLRNDCKILSIR